MSLAKNLGLKHVAALFSPAVKRQRMGMEPRFLAVCMLVLLVSLAVAMRVTAPSAIHIKDQGKTTGYSVDILENGHYLLPADTGGFPATKPPLFNYFSVPFLKAFGYREWVFMLPSFMAFLATLWLLYGIARHTFEALPDRPSVAGVTARQWAVILTVAFYALSGMTLRLAYTARPDMLLVFNMTLAWYAATRALYAERPSGGWWAFLFWTAVGLSALTKGPSALLPLAYGFLAPAFLLGDYRRVNKLRPWVGLPAVALISLAWPAAVFVLNPDHFVTILLKKELGGQLGPAWYSGILSSYKVPFILVTRFLPWSLLLFVTVVRFDWRRWRSHPLAPAILYTAIMMAAFAFLDSRRPDRFACFHPPVAIICAWTAVYGMRTWKVLKASLVALPLVTLATGGYFHFGAKAARSRGGEKILFFVAKVREIRNGRPIIFCSFDASLVQALLGVNQRGRYIAKVPEGGSWVATTRPPPSAKVVVSSDPTTPPGSGSLHIYWAESGERICNAEMTNQENNTLPPQGI